jgi:hypothetical protein
VIDMYTNYRLAPATPGDLSWISEKEVAVYGHNPADVMPFDLLLRWYRKNPSCFWMILRGDNERIGNIYLLPLKPPALDLLISGEIMERDIRPADIFSNRESAKITTLHIISLVCPGSSEAVAYCLRNFTSIAGTICDPRRISRIYALSASKRGDSLLSKNGFKQIRSAAERKDGHPYYSAEYTDFINSPRLLRLRIR